MGRQEKSNKQLKTQGEQKHSSKSEKPGGIHFQDNRPESQKQRTVQKMANDYVEQTKLPIQKMANPNAMGGVVQRHVKKGIYKVSYFFGQPNLRRNNPPRYTEIAGLPNGTVVQVNQDAKRGSSFTILGAKTKEHTWGVTSKGTGWITDDKLAFESNLPIAAASSHSSSSSALGSSSSLSVPQGNERLLGHISKPTLEEREAHDRKYNFVVSSVDKDNAEYNFTKRSEIVNITSELSSQFPNAYKNKKNLKGSALKSAVAAYIKPTLEKYVGPREKGHSIWIAVQNGVPTLLGAAYNAGYPLDNEIVQKAIANAVTRQAEMESKGTGSSGHVSNFRR